MAGTSGVGGVALVHAVVEHDPVDVVDHLGLVAELDRLTEAALGDRGVEGDRAHSARNGDPVGVWVGVAGGELLERYPPHRGPWS